MAVSDWRRGRRTPRTALAESFTILYVAIATLSLAVAITAACGNFLLPLLLVAPIAIVQLFYDSKGRGRTLMLMPVAIGFSKSGKPVTAKKLGLRELGFGAMKVFAVILGHAVGW